MSLSNKIHISTATINIARNKGDKRKEAIRDWVAAATARIDDAPCDVTKDFAISTVESSAKHIITLMQGQGDVENVELMKGLYKNIPGAFPLEQ